MGRTAHSMELARIEIAGRSSSFTKVSELWLGIVKIVKRFTIYTTTTTLVVVRTYIAGGPCHSSSCRPW